MHPLTSLTVLNFPLCYILMRTCQHLPPSSSRIWLSLTWSPRIPPITLPGFLALPLQESWGSTHLRFTHNSLCTSVCVPLALLHPICTPCFLHSLYSTFLIRRWTTEDVNFTGRTVRPEIEMCYAKNARSWHQPALQPTIMFPTLWSVHDGQVEIQETEQKHLKITNFSKIKL